jgi:hypothetical protein
MRGSKREGGRRKITREFGKDEDQMRVTDINRETEEAKERSKE